MLKIGGGSIECSDCKKSVGETSGSWDQTTFRCTVCDRKHGIKLLREALRSSFGERYSPERCPDETLEEVIKYFEAQAQRYEKAKLEKAMQKDNSYLSNKEIKEEAVRILNSESLTKSLGQCEKFLTSTGKLEFVNLAQQTCKMGDCTMGKNIILRGLDKIHD